jgi:hypothetical protein
MKRTAIAVMALLVLAGAWKLGGVIAVASDQSNDNNIAILDDCDPADPTWTPVGGCTLKPHQGDVSRAEFGQLLFSPLGGGPMGVLIGHPSWRNEPSYLSTEQGKTIRVKNGGRETSHVHSGCAVWRRTCPSWIEWSTSARAGVRGDRTRK